MDGFVEAVETAWNSVQPRHCPVETLSLKLKATARGLQSWSQKKIGHISSQLLMAKEIIHQFDIAQESRNLQPNELWLRNNLKKHSCPCLPVTDNSPIEIPHWVAQRGRCKYQIVPHACPSPKEEELHCQSEGR